MGDKIVQMPLVSRLQLNLRCLLFSTGRSNGGTTLHGGDGGGNALFSLFQVSKTLERPFTENVSQLILSPIVCVEELHLLHEQPLRNEAKTTFKLIGALHNTCTVYSI